MLSLGKVSTGFDFDAPGKRSGFIDVRISDNDHAFSDIRVPVGVVHGGPGPTVLMTAGSHGDEYEGQAILHRLMQELTPQDVFGRMILLPALNTPAVLTKARVSPLDDGNMNRIFPGDPTGGPTAAIAAFVSAFLIPIADVILDFHSGGSATHFLDCGFLSIGPDTKLNAANLMLAEAFGAPYTIVCRIDGTGGDFDTAALNQQTKFLACELGGLGRYSQSSFEIGWQGTHRVLAHLGLLAGSPKASRTRFIDLFEQHGLVTVAHHGLAQIHVSSAQNVRQGDLLATVFDVHNFGQILAELHAERNGVIAVLRRSPMVKPGDHLCYVAQEISRPDQP